MLGIYELFYLVFRVDTFKIADIVERRYSLRCLKDVAEFSPLVAQVQDTIRKHRA